MKKSWKIILSLCLILALLLSLCALSFPAGAEEEIAGETPAREPVGSGRSGDYEYEYYADSTASITRYSGWDAEVVIPAELDGHPVTAIGEQAFYYASLTAVTIPEGVTTIGDSAFSDCISLTAVTIPDSVTEIGVNPFVRCIRLTEINVSPEHPALEVIDGVLFEKTSKRLVTYPCAFTAAEYSIPQGIEEIGGYAFAYCESLTAVTIPDSVTTIGDYAFSQCESLTAVTIPEGVTSIGEAAFYECYFLTSVTVPESVTAIGNGAFADCPNLTLTVPRDSYAAQYCKDNGIAYQYADAHDWLLN